MTVFRIRRTAQAAMCASLLVAFGVGGRASAPPQAPAQYSALAVDMLSGVPGAATTSLNIVVTRWTTPAEQDALITALLEKGQGALLEALRKAPRAGSIAPIGGVGFEVRYATRQVEMDGTERILLISDRPMSFLERWDGGRSTDYPFTVVQLRLKPSGDGDGQASVAARIAADRRTRTVVLDNYNDQPVVLTSVKRLP